MKNVQCTIDSQIQERLRFQKLSAKLIRKKLRGKGVALADDQLAVIESKLLNLRGGAVRTSIGKD